MIPSSLELRLALVVVLVEEPKIHKIRREDKREDKRRQERGEEGKKRSLNFSLLCMKERQEEEK